MLTVRQGHQGDAPVTKSWWDAPHSHTHASYPLTSDVPWHLGTITARRPSPDVAPQPWTSRPVTLVSFLFHKVVQLPMNTQQAAYVHPISSGTKVRTQVFFHFPLYSDFLVVVFWSIISCETCFSLYVWRYLHRTFQLKLYFILKARFDCKAMFLFRCQSNLIIHFC